jgi:membrane-bound serine protease (ClpP class)
MAPVALPAPRANFVRGDGMAILAGMRSIVLALSMLLMATPSVRAHEPIANSKAIGEPLDAPKAALPRPAQSQWLDRVAEFFRLPAVYLALITLGIIGLVFEFKLPGTTFPGSVAAICFVLFFWAHSFVGEFTLLAIMLFLLGLVFLGIEVFVVPGLGFSGVAGAVLMFLGLLLVTLEHWPNDQKEWTEFGSTFGTLAIGIALAVVGAVALTWSLPNIPLLNKMVLKPPSAEVEHAMPMSMSHSGPVDLLGAIGVAVTPLRPSGKAQFGGQFLDVIAEGDYVAPGGRVQVIEIEGTRIVVKEV